MPSYDSLPFEISVSSSVSSFIISYSGGGLALALPLQLFDPPFSSICVIIRILIVPTRWGLLFSRLRGGLGSVTAMTAEAVL
jgi:hypothetical protein